MILPIGHIGHGAKIVSVNVPSVQIQKACRPKAGLRRSPRRTWTMPTCKMKYWKTTTNSRRKAVFGSHGHLGDARDVVRKHMGPHSMREGLRVGLMVARKDRERLDEGRGWQHPHHHQDRHRARHYQPPERGREEPQRRALQASTTLEWGTRTATAASREQSEM